jgi:hypothetical protein
MGPAGAMAVTGPFVIQVSGLGVPGGSAKRMEGCKGNRINIPDRIKKSVTTDINRVFSIFIPPLEIDIILILRIQISMPKNKSWLHDS